MPQSDFTFFQLRRLSWFSRSHRIFYNFLTCRCSTASFADSNLSVSKLGSVAQGHGSWYLFRRSNFFGSFVSCTSDVCACSNPWISKMDSFGYCLCIDNLLMKADLSVLETSVTAVYNNITDTSRVT